MISFLHAPLSKAIYQEYVALMNIIKPLSHAMRTAQIITGGDMVSASDIVAYQIGWGKLLLNWYNSGIAHKMPTMPGDGFTTWDYAAIAQHFYIKYHYDDSAQQDAVFAEVVQNILNMVEAEYSSGNLDKLGVWHWCTLKSGRQWPLSKWVQVNTIAPYKRAQKLIRSYIKSLK